MNINQTFGEMVTESITNAVDHDTRGETNLLFIDTFEELGLSGEAGLPEGFDKDAITEVAVASFKEFFTKHLNRSVEDFLDC